MWVVHWGLPLRLPWRTQVCPCEGQVWRWCSCLGRRGSGSTRFSGGLAAGAAGIQCSRRVWQPVLANTLQCSCLENHPDILQRCRVGRNRSDPACIDARLFLPVAALPQWGLNMKLAQLLGLWGPWRCQVCRDMACLSCRSYGTIRIFFRASCSWRSEGLFGQSFSVALPVQVHRGLPFLGSSSVVWGVRHREGSPGRVLRCSLAHQALKGAP